MPLTPGFLQDATGADSSGRLIMVFTIFITVVVWASSTIIAAVKGTTPLPIPAEIITLCLGTGVLKVTNSALSENKGAVDASKQ
jgi:hypothetical protein